METEYALYKGDEFIDLGTKEYLAKILNVTPRTIYYYSTPTYRKRVEDRKKDTTQSYITIKIECEDE